VFLGRGLSTAVAGQETCRRGMQTRIVVQGRMECKSRKGDLGRLAETRRLRLRTHESTTTAVRRGWLIAFWRRTTAVASRYVYLQHQTRAGSKSCITRDSFARAIRETQDETAASAGSLALRHHFSSWLNSVISIPGITMNLQLNISLGSSSSGNWQETRQYWQS
jgi:hypothetical protein